MATWKKHYQPQLVTARIESGRKLSKEGKVSFTGFDISEYMFLLSSMLSIDSGIPEYERSRLINAAIFAAGKNGPVSPPSMLSAVNRLEKGYLNRDKHSYRLVTAISVPSTCSFPAVRYSGSTITVNPKQNKAILVARQKCLTEAKQTLFSNLPSRYTPVSVSIQARSEHEAADSALDRFDFVRAIWNLSINRRKSFRISWGRKKPVNSIVSGPIHTLHLKNGELATDSWWYESEYQGPTDLWRSAHFMSKMLNYTHRFRNKLMRLPFRESMIDALIRYVRALDSQNWQTSFLQLWGILELLTYTQKSSYDVTIRRVSFLFQDREYTRQVLNHLREFRNRSVHIGAGTEHIEKLMYQSKRYVEILLCFLVGNSFRFNSMEEAGEFLGTTPNRIRIRRKLAWLKYADKFLSHSI